MKKTTGHQSVRGRGGVISGGVGDALDGTFETVLGAGNGPPALWPRGFTLLDRHSESAPPYQSCTAGCELVLHNGNSLGVTVCVSWRPATATFRTQIGFAATAPRYIPTEPTFGTKTMTVCGRLGSSARARLRVGYIWCHFRMTRDRDSSFSCAIHDFDGSCTRFLVSANTFSEHDCTWSPT